MVVPKMIRQTIAAVMLVAMVGAGCSFSPVYSDGSPINAMSLAFDFAKPTTRLEQIAYQELALRFATSSAPRTPKMKVTVSTGARDLTMTPTAPGAQDNYRTTATVTAVVTYEGKTIFTAGRTASADFKHSGQVLADRSAATEAQERATKAATESLRLAILATFPNSASYL